MFLTRSLGCTVLDVAMHMYHGVEMSGMEAGGEDELIAWYHGQLTAMLSEEDAAAYPLEVRFRQCDPTLCVR